MDRKTNATKAFKLIMEIIEYPDDERIQRFGYAYRESIRSLLAPQVENYLEHSEEIEN